jgi:hypothetical protein
MTFSTQIHQNYPSHMVPSHCSYTLINHGSFLLQPNTLKLPVPNYPLACILPDILTKVLNHGMVIQFSPSWISSFYSHQHHALWMAYIHCRMYETGSDRSKLMELISSKMKEI